MADLVTDQERLAEIKATLRHWDAMYAQHGLAPLPPAVAAQESARHLNRAQIDWLVGQLEEWRQAAGAEANLADERGRELERLRGLLTRLEWAGAKARESGSSLVIRHCCPACRGSEPDHRANCWLAAELDRTQKGRPAERSTMSIGDLTAMQSFEHGRCPVCWTVIRNEDETKHMEWHQKLVNSIAEAMRPVAGQR